MHRIVAPLQTLLTRYTLKTHLFFIFVLGIVYAFILVGDHSMRLASVHSDNGLVAYSYLFKFPDMFANDVFSIYGPKWIYATITFWLPALLFKNLDLAPEIFDHALMLLQSALPGPAMFLFAFKTTRSLMVAYLSALIMLCALPWGWNLANYPAVMNMSFYTTLTMSTAVLSVCAAVSGRWGVATAFATLSSLVHPITALFLAAYYGILFLIQRDRRVLAVTVSCFTGLLPLFLSPHTSLPALSSAEQWQAMIRHIHAVPWSAYPPLWNHSAPLFGCYFIISLFALCEVRKTNPTYFKHLLAALGMVLLLSASHVLGYAAGSLKALTITGLRSTALYVLFTLPAVMKLMTPRKESLLFGLHGAMLILAFALNDTHYVLIASVFFVFLHVLQFSWGPVRQHFKKVRLSFPLEQILLASLFIALAFLVFRTARIEGNESRSSQLSSLYDAQVWAETHTETKDKFITNTSWRTLSHRPALSIDTNFAFQVYLPVKPLREVLDSEFEILCPGKKWTDYSTIEIGNMLEKGYSELNESRMVALADRSGAKYAVRGKTTAKLLFPVAYQNADFTIYKLR